ncbi:MAG TPA: lysylphosphatidylglycerol synthase transmembrane domain-containing protein [Acidobacteriaceae bacterium]|nr:lysylphosphatidylglycerol synthase transmembrane domain-containing protein [Acidobacteriaceae bacterium]
MEQVVTEGAGSAGEGRLKLLKTLPGLAISAFFLWWTFRGLHREDFRNIHLAEPMWVAGIVGFTLLGYTTRSFRWWMMLRSVRSRFVVCARVFLTSLAANNILPLRIGDVMRIFTYAEDLGTTPSIVLSTVILEKFLDVFTLAALFVITMHTGRVVSPHLRLAAKLGLGISTAGLLILVFGAQTLQPLIQRTFAGTKNAVLAKLEHWLVLALDCIRQIGVAGSLLLVVISFIAWGFEGMMYVSASRLLGLSTDWAGPWQAVSQANLSFLIPSSPGGLGTFDLACKDALQRHGVTDAAALAFSLLIHGWLLVVLTGVGGIWFLVHRLHRARRKPLVEELETLPAELP